MGDQLQVLQQTVDRLEQQVSAMRGATTADVVGTLGTPIANFQPPVTAAPRPAADQQLRNGDESHSTGSWWRAVVAANDEFLEAAHWFSNDAPVTGQALDFTDARTSSVNKALKSATHSTYNAAYCDWDIVRGVARLTGDKSLDAVLPGNPVVPGRGEFFGGRIARRNSTIVIQDDNRIMAMLYNATPGSEDFMQAGNAFAIEGAVRNESGGAIATTQRKYKVLAETDRGYTFLSTELDLPAAPADAAFGPGVDVYLTWPRIDGVLFYKIYRHDITAAKYRLLKTISSGVSAYGDNNRQDDPDVGGYPASTYDKVNCIVATRDGTLSDLAVDGEGDWDDLFLNIPVPDPLLSAANDHQVFRLAMAKAMDRKMIDAVSTTANARVSSASAVFTAQDTGRIATLYAADGVTVLHGPEAITFVDATHVDFATNVATSGADRVLYIAGGGDHGLLIDLLHLSYIDRAKYSSWPEDRTRTLAPTATPNESGQGGIGTGGDTGDPGDGGIGCIPMYCPAWVYEGDCQRAVPFERLRRGMAMVSGNITPNFANKLPVKHTDNLHIVSFENGVWVPCSPGQPFFTSAMDRQGTRAERLRVGDFGITMREGKMERSRVIEVRATGKPATVGSPVLTPGNSYVAGYLRLRWYERLWRWLAPKDRGASGALLHNRKNEELAL